MPPRTFRNLDCRTNRLFFKEHVGHPHFIDPELCIALLTGFCVVPWVPQDFLVAVDIFSRSFLFSVVYFQLEKKRVLPQIMLLSLCPLCLVRVEPRRRRFASIVHILGGGLRGNRDRFPPPQQVRGIGENPAHTATARQIKNPIAQLSSHSPRRSPS